jgi:hypothetical protein
VSFAIDGDGGRGDAHEQHDMFRIATVRTLVKYGASVAVHPWSGGTWDPRVFTGAGIAWEFTHVRILDEDWVNDGDGFRPLAFAGLAVEWLHAVSDKNRIGIAIDVRATYLGGESPMSTAPELSRLGVQASLELNASLGR